MKYSHAESIIESSTRRHWAEDHSHENDLCSYAERHKQ